MDSHLFPPNRTWTILGFSENKKEKEKERRKKKKEKSKKRPLSGQM